MQRTPLKRAAAGLTALAMAGVGVLALAPPASAEVVGDATLTPVSRPTLLTGTTGGDAGNWTLALPTGADIGDTITIRVGPACTNDADAIEFADVPAETNANLAGVLSGDCGTADNIVTFAVSGAAIPVGNITLTSVDLNIGGDVAPGALAVNINGGAAEPAASNAFVAKVDRPAAGVSRYDTAARLALEAYPTPDVDCVGSNEVIIVSGADANVYDALTAAPLAGKKNVPILLVTPSAPLPSQTANALTELGVNKVTIIGGSLAVSDAVEAALEAREVTACGGGNEDGTVKIEVERIFGTTRYLTSQAVASELGAAGNFDGGLEGACNPVKTAFVVSGDAPADALAAGPLAARGAADGGCGANSGQLPIILTTTAGLNPQAIATINELAIKQVILVGGAAVLNTQVEVDAFALGVNPERRGGTTGGRQQTAQLVNALALDPSLGSFDGGRAYVATGLAFADALTAGPIAGQRQAPTVLTSTASSLGVYATSTLKDNKSILWASLLGGNTALTPALATEVGTAFTSRSSAIV